VFHAVDLHGQAEEVDETAGGGDVVAVPAKKTSNREAGYL